MSNFLLIPFRGFHILRMPLNFERPTFHTANRMLSPVAVMLWEPVADLQRPSVGIKPTTAEEDTRLASIFPPCLRERLCARNGILKLWMFFLPSMKT